VLSVGVGGKLGGTDSGVCDSSHFLITLTVYDTKASPNKAIARG
jgi:hypothetical protein